jgi:hypothetical protein
MVVPGAARPAPRSGPQREGTGSNDGTSGPHPPSPMSHATLSRRSTTPAALTSHCPCPEYTSHTRRPRSCPGRRMPGAARPGPRSGPQRTALERGCVQLVPRAQSCAAPAVAATTARAALTRHHRRPMRSLRDAQRHQQPSQDIAHVLKHLTHRQPAAPGRCAPGPAQRAAAGGHRQQQWHERPSHAVTDVPCGAFGTVNDTSGAHEPSTMSRKHLSHPPTHGSARALRAPRPRSGPQRTALERAASDWSRDWLQPRRAKPTEASGGKLRQAVA